MNDNHTARLRDVLAGLYDDADRTASAGLGLSAAELRRVGSLRRAADLVQQAIDTLASERGAEPPIRYRDGGLPDGEPGNGGREWVQEFDLSGDDDTPGWRRRRPGAQGEGKEDGGTEER